MSTYASSSTWITDAVHGWSPEPLLASGSTTAWAVEAFAALLDVPSPGGSGAELPPLWHWLGFLDRARQDELGVDGHPIDGHFLPPVPDRRRMYAGGRLIVESPMRVGEQLERRSSLVGKVAKSGRSGDMLLVTVRHEFLRQGRVVVTEEQDFVYRSQPQAAPRDESVVAAPKTVAAGPEPDPATPSGAAIELLPDASLLFRFSALTYNAHRIHYDQPYATGVEGYPGLVVHGPLLALLLLEVPRRRAEPVRRISYRVSRPVFAGQRVVADVAPEQPDAGVTLVAGLPGSPPSITATIET